MTLARSNVDPAPRVLASDPIVERLLNESGTAGEVQAQQQVPDAQQHAVQKCDETSVAEARELFNETPIPESSLTLRVTMPAKNKGGRPRRLTDEVRQQVALLLSVGLSRRRAAQRVGVSHTTISRAAKEDPVFAEQLERAEHLAASERTVHIAKLSRRSWKAAAWLILHHEKYPSVAETRSEEW